ncbi:uncharacterized protein V1516DRAFT_642243 [Lipomyces oligophaga]|uniref:uncharacterized protein n=1 Tax=Lipomyces oligophaga TaxID=45792 RepID=UPI0034CDC770
MSLFGNTPTPAFGSSTASQAPGIKRSFSFSGPSSTSATGSSSSTTPGLFASTAATPSGTTAKPLFGSTAGTAPMFGSTAGSTPSLFASTNQAPALNSNSSLPATSTTFSFGGAKPAASSTPSSSTSQPVTSSGFSFGNTKPAVVPGLSSNPSQPAASTGFSFGSTQPAAPSGFSLNANPTSVPGASSTTGATNTGFSFNSGPSIGTAPGTTTTPASTSFNLTAPSNTFTGNTTTPQFGQNTTSTSLFSTAAGKPSTTTLPPPTQITSITSLTRHSDLPTSMQQELDSIDSYISSQITISDDFAARKSAHSDYIHSVPTDVEMLGRTLAGATQALTNDTAAVSETRDLVDTTVNDTAHCLSILQYLRTPGARLPPGDPLLAYFDRRASGLESKLTDYTAVLADVDRAVDALNQESLDGGRASPALGADAVLRALKEEYAVFMALGNKVAEYHHTVARLESRER